MIYIGNQTSCWAASPGEPFDYALANGFNAFEWFPDKKPGAGWDESDLNEAQRSSICQTARRRGIRLSVHARNQANPISPDSSAVIQADLKLAQDIGAFLLNIHLYHEQGIPTFIKAITPLIQQVAKAGIQLSIENTPLHAPELFNELFALLRADSSLPIESVGFCLDVGHANLCSATQNDYLAFLKRLDPHVPLNHLHLHENWGDADTHLPLFTGPAAQNDSAIRFLVKWVQRRAYSGSIILEQWPRPPALLNNARTKLLALLRQA